MTCGMPSAFEREIQSLTQEALLQCFAALDAPDLREMDGEYAARMLPRPGVGATVFGKNLLNNPLQRWLCKAFYPDNAISGRGYNTFDVGGRLIQRYPMATRVVSSRFDGRPVFQLTYRAYASMGVEVPMVDEVRRIEEGLYLGIGTWGLSARKRRLVYPFLLKGPLGPYQSDIGHLPH